MELTNDFRVDVPLDEAWQVLTDVERIAPCMPGAQLQEIEGDEFRGIVKVKVGPITAQYKGAARFLEKDDDAKKAVLKAEGRDTRGQGNANATITATLKADGSGTAVTVVTDLTVTGKVAQFGRGVLADVSSKLLSQFVECLEGDLLAPSANGGSSAEAPAAAAGKAEKAEAVSASFEPSKVSVAEPVAESGTGNGASSPKPSNVTAPAAPTAPNNGSKATDDTAASQVRKIESKPAEAVDLLDAAGIPVAKRAIPVVAGVLLLLWFLRRRRRASR